MVFTSGCRAPNVLGKTRDGERRTREERAHFQTEVAPPFFSSNTNLISALLLPTGNSTLRRIRHPVGTWYHQKYTTLMYTAGLAPILHGWDTLRCNHTSHAADAGGTLNTDGWSSRTTAAYPADMNLALARAFASLLQVSALGQLPVPEVSGVELQIPATVTPTAETPMPPAPVLPPHAPYVPTETHHEDVPHTAPEDSSAPATSLPISPRKPSKPPTWERVGHPLRSSLRSAVHVTTGGSVPRIGWALASFGVSKVASKAGAALIAATADRRGRRRTQSTGRTHAHRLDHEGWIKSEHEELMNHLTNGSFILVDRDSLPPSHAKRRLVKFYSSTDVHLEYFFIFHLLYAPPMIFYV